MTIDRVVEKAKLKVLTGDTSKEFSGVYVGDLLSRCMSHVIEGDVWITIMNNVNVVAVASLTDCAAVILAEGVEMPQDVINTATEKEITILSSEKTAYELCCLIKDLLD